MSSIERICNMLLIPRSDVTTKEAMTSLLEEFSALGLVILRGKSTSLLFCPERFVLMKLSDEGLAAAELALSLDDPGELVEGSQVAAFLRNAVDFVSKTPKLQISLPELLGPKGESRSLPKLVLMVNNCCNLQCRYCYEKDAAFKEPARCMSRSTVRAAIARCYEFFSGIESVMFIGGEPTLSEEAIEEACTFATSEASRLGRAKPRFGMITNGVRISDHVYELIETFEIQLTFSLDGPKPTNDLVRIRRDGSGSYDAVSANIKRYAAQHAATLSLESTVTRAQSDSGLSITELMNFLAVEFGVKDPHIAVGSLPDGHPLMPVGGAAEAMDRGFSDAVDLSVANILAERLSGGSIAGARLSFVADMMRALADRSATSAMCSAGTAQIVVDAHGDVYPCWMFAGMPDLRLGNILEDGLARMLSGDVIERVRGNTKLTNEACSTCYARFVCHACIGSNQIRTGFIEGADPRFCDRTRQSLVTVLSAIALGRVEPSPQTVD
jgi:uncharacterized protein